MPTNRSSHLRLFWATALMVASLSWVFFAYTFVPAMIAEAYGGESLKVFNHLILGQANHPLTEYLARWSRLASKVTTGLALLGVYILVAMVGLTREPTIERREPTNRGGMSKGRLAVVYGLSLLIFGGALSDLARDTEHWPFSQYPMFSRIDVSKTFSRLQLYGVVQHSPLIEVPMDINLYLQPFDNSRLPPALEHALRENRLEEGVTDCLTRYEALRRAGRHKGPPLVAMRLYRLTWTLDTSASNVDRPDRRDLVTEVPMRRDGAD